MKKVILGLLLVFLVAMCFGFEQKDTYHSIFSSCNIYRGKSVTLTYNGKVNTSKTVNDCINELMNDMKNDYMVKDKNIKPYKDETKAAYELITRYFEPEKNEVYSMVTEISYGVCRIIFIWIRDGNKFNYEIYEVSNK